jgi:hypothetical protein
MNEKCWVLSQKHPIETKNIVRTIYQLFFGIYEEAINYCENCKLDNGVYNFRVCHEMNTIDALKWLKSYSKIHYNEN